MPYEQTSYEDSIPGYVRIDKINKEMEKLEKEIELKEQSDEYRRLTLSKILWGEQEESAVYPASWENLFSALEKRVDTPYPVAELIAENERLKRGVL